MFGIPERFCELGVGALPETWCGYGSCSDADLGQHGFVDDWRLEALWRSGGESAGPACCYVEPDFSLPSGSPGAWVIYQTWRSRCVGQWIEAQTSRCVIPVLNWCADPETWRYSILGIGRGSWVATRGAARGATPAERRLYRDGLAWAVSQIEPSGLVCFGPCDDAELVCDRGGIRLLHRPIRAASVR
jgi:hypothetical protein